MAKKNSKKIEIKDISDEELIEKTEKAIEDAKKFLFL